MFIAHRFFTFSATFTGFPTPLDCLSITQMTRTCYFYPTSSLATVYLSVTDRTPPVVRPKPLLRFILKATKLTMSLGNSANTFYLCLFIEINRL